MHEHGFRGGDGSAADLESARELVREFFGMLHEPFAGEPETESWYSNGEIREIYRSLIAGIAERPGLFLITGAAGVGKTCLMRRLSAELRGVGYRVLPHYAAGVVVDDLLTTIGEDLGIGRSTRDAAEWLEELDRHLAERAGPPVVLAIDNGERLGANVLAVVSRLLQLRGATERGLRVLICAHPELSRRLDLPIFKKLNTRIALHCRLDRLSDDAAAAYIFHRLRAAGCRGTELFTPSAIDDIVAHTAGLPRRLHLLCFRSLLHAALDRQQRVTAPIVAGAIEALSLKRTVMPTPDLPVQHARSMVAASLAAGTLAVSIFALSFDRGDLATVARDAEPVGGEVRDPWLPADAGQATLRAMTVAAFDVPVLDRRIAAPSATNPREPGPTAVAQSGAGPGAEPDPAATVSPSIVPSPLAGSPAPAATAGDPTASRFSAEAPEPEPGSGNADARPESAPVPLKAVEMAPQPEPAASAAEPEPVAVAPESGPATPPSSAAPASVAAPGEAAAPEHVGSETAGPPPAAPAADGTPLTNADPAVADAVRRARSEMAAGHLIDPPDDNAVEIYRGVAAKAPASEATQSLRGALRGALGEAARSAVAAGRIAEAQRLYELALDPDRAALEPSGVEPGPDPKAAASEGHEPAAAPPAQPPSTPEVRPPSAEAASATQQAVAPQPQPQPVPAPSTPSTVSAPPASAPALSAPAAGISAIPPSTSSPAALPGASTQAVATMIERGDQLLAIGDIAAARLFYERAVAGGSARAATALGKTHDPVFFRDTSAFGIRPDAVVAASWYRRALAMGDHEAQVRLQRLEDFTALSGGASGGTSLPTGKAGNQ